MSGITRRRFIKHVTAGAAAAALLPSEALRLRGNPLGIPIGCQTWPVRQMMAKDVPGTLKMLAAAGFQAVELCSPVGYADEGFGSLANYGWQLRNMISDAGLVCASCHFTLEELRKNQADRIAWARNLGLTQMIVPTLEGPEHPTMDDVKRAADEYNKLAEKAAAAGIQQGLHNEDFLLTTVNGQRTYDLLFGLLDPKLVKFQFQVSTIAQGYDAAAYFTKYPGRFISMHAQGWDAKNHKEAPIGQDSLDWKKIFTAAQTGGIRNYFVEMDLDLMKASVPYLRELQV
ncbi:MAG TPA: TIM barrel protein [Terriglobia bacterium]|nr:TIM barrel protein [Terriglobia bacterium]